jgi:hypothetical protein
MSIAGSKDNLDQNISRLRRAIEPFYTIKKTEDKYIYVQRSISSGTWLEKKTCHFT